MMRIVMLGLLSALGATVVLFGQGGTIPPPPIVDVVASIGSEADAAAVMRLVLPHSNREFFLARQIRREWVPAGSEQLIRLNDAEAVDHLNACGVYWVVSRVERSGDVVTLDLSQRCGGTLLSYTASLERGAWHLGPPNMNGRGFGPGIGSGFTGRPEGCPCIK
jgi:hypothetical protein